MHPLVNHLIQLQELTLIKDEQKVSHGGEYTEQLEASIQAMASELPGDVRVQFEKLHFKNHNAMVPISDDICCGCGMRLPVSLIQAVRIGKSILLCPQCARMLYYPESAPRHIRKGPRRSDPKKPGISRFSSQTLMIPRLESETKDGVVREMARKMETEEFVHGAELLVEAALRRESIVSTAVGHGLAFPHARSVEGGGLTLALGISRKGINFDSRDRSLTRIVFFITIPTAASAFYLKLLAGLTETFMKPEARKALMAETEPGPLWKALVKLTRATIK